MVFDDALSEVIFRFEPAILRWVLVWCVWGKKDAVDFPFAFFQTCIDGVQKRPDQVSCVESSPVPDDKDAFGVGIYLFQKPAQKFDGVFHVRPIQLSQMELAAEQV